MIENVKALIQIIEEKYHSIVALISVLAVEILFFVNVDSFFTQFLSSTTIRGLVYAVIILISISSWLSYKYRLPRNKKKGKKIGIVIAIYSESEIERQKLKADFISELKEMLTQEGISTFAEVYFLKNHFSQQIVESCDPVKTIKEFNKKIGGHFYVWGRIKKRPDNSEDEKYVLTFQGYVVHKPISQELSNEIARDFSSVLPREITFPEREFRGFEASAVMLHLAIKYVIGLAAFVSQDPRLAFRLHNGLRECFNAYKPLPSCLQNIRNKIPLLLSEETGWIAKWHYYKNMKKADANSFLNQSLKENNKNYGSWLFKAIVDFESGNLKEAFKSLGNAEKYANGDCTWLYSKAFLYYWQGSFDKALKLCQKIKNQTNPGQEIVCKEVRNFNLQILEKDESKPQLWFWIGYLSYFKEQNFPQALEDFEKFEESENGSASTLKNKSTAYLTEIKHKMKINS